MLKSQEYFNPCDYSSAKKYKKLQIYLSLFLKGEFANSASANSIYQLSSFNKLKEHLAIFLRFTKI